MSRKNRIKGLRGIRIEYRRARGRMPGVAVGGAAAHEGTGLGDWQMKGQGLSPMKAKSKDYSAIMGNSPLWNGVYGSFLCLR